MHNTYFSLVTCRVAHSIFKPKLRLIQCSPIRAINCGGGNYIQPQGDLLDAINKYINVLPFRLKRNVMEHTVAPKFYSSEQARSEYLDMKNKSCNLSGAVLSYSTTWVPAWFVKYIVVQTAFHLDSWILFMSF